MMDLSGAECGGTGVLQQAEVILRPSGGGKQILGERDGKPTGADIPLAIGNARK